MRQLMVTALGLVVVTGCNRDRQQSQSPDPCADGMCEAETDCELGLCGVDALTITPHSPNAGTFASGEVASCPYNASEVPPLEALTDDSQIPEFDRRRSRASNYKKGRASLQDHELHEHLLQVQGALFECLDMASCYQEEEIGGGELEFEFELESSGRVTAVSVMPSDGLRDNPIVEACARKSVYEFEFPSWNGARMVVSYSVEFDESV